MQCEQFEDRLNDLLDRRRDPRSDDQLTAHALVCENCRDLAESYQRLTVGASLLRTVAATPAAVPTVHRSWSAAAVVGPLLAVAAVAMFALLRPAPPSGPSEVPSPTIAAVAKTPEIAATPAAPVIAAAPIAAAAPAVVDLGVVDLARSTGRAYVGLIQGTARGVDEALALATTLPPPHQLLEPMLFPEDGVLRRVGSEWAPVAGETLDALRQVFRPGDSHQL